MPAKKKAKGKLTLTLNEVSQDIDLASYLDRKPTSSEKRAFASLAVDRIINRSLDNENVNGGGFKKYSKEYAKFKGVTRSSVDMFLDGKMFKSMKRIAGDEKGGDVHIGFKGGIENKKAFNHTTGDTLPKREFFGITDQEARDIADEIDQGGDDGPKLNLAELRASLNLLTIDQILDDNDGSF